MKNRTFLFFVLILFALSLACGEATSTSTPKISTATSQTSNQANDQTQNETSPVSTDTSSENAQPMESATNTPEPPPMAFLGDLVELEGYSFAAVTVENPAPPGILYTPVEGEKLIAIEVIVGNVAGEPVRVNVLNSTLVDAEGFTYQPKLGGRDGQIDLVELSPGERIKGWISFNIPETAIPNLIKYEVSSFPSIVLQSQLTTVDGGLVADPNVPLTDSGEVERAVIAVLGDLVEQDGYSLVAEVVEDPTTPGILYSPTEGTKLIAVQIVVGNVSGEVITVNPLNATLVDTNGFVYTAEAGGRDEQLELVDLAPGERVRGWVAFEVSETAIPESIKYQVSGFPLIVLQTGLTQ